MNVSLFISASSVVLLTWLGATYLHQVPFERYPKQDRHNSGSASVTPVKDSEMLAENISKTLIDQ